MRLCYQVRGIRLASCAFDDMQRSKNLRRHDDLVDTDSFPFQTHNTYLVDPKSSPVDTKKKHRRSPK